ncbi:efflux transporter outer membrane subunit [Formicincola oecophyllae]|nr:efflux transporter outer membrane subunit [Formicincola oecophyllae]
MLGPDDKPPPLPKGSAYAAHLQKTIPGLKVAETNAPPGTPQAQAEAANSVLRVQRLVEEMDIPGRWWEMYRCPKLNQLVSEALVNSPNLRAMQHSLQQAWEQRRVEGASLYPTISGQFIPTWNQVSHAYSNVPMQNYWVYGMHTLQTQVGYVPDLWGGATSAIVEAAAQADVQRFQVEATAMTLITNVVNAAFNDGSLRAQVATQNQLIHEADAILTIMDGQQMLGDVAQTTVYLQHDVVATQKAALAPLKKQFEQNRDQMALLAGQPPNAPMPEFQMSDFTLPAKLPLSLPARLLEQRPDVQAARAQITAAAAQVGVAIAQRLPNLQLSASPGYAAESLHKFFTPSMGQFALMSTITQPLFQGGSLIHAQRAAKQQFLQSLEYYKHATLTGLNDVAQTLHALNNDSEGVLATYEQLDNARHSLALVERQHRLGDNSQIDVLAVRFLVTQKELAMEQASLQRFSDSVALIQALGGGWWNRNDLGLNPEDVKTRSSSLLPW